MLLIGSDYHFLPDDYFYGTVPASIGDIKYQKLLIDIKNQLSEEKSNFINSLFQLVETAKKRK